MECVRVKELLSEYIDGVLDTRARAGVEKHIAVCEGCKEDLASMSALVEELGGLKPVKAPPDFLEEIHGRLRPRFQFGRMARKLFVPFRIKIPLELAAAATMAVLVFSVLSLQEGDREKEVAERLSDGPVGSVLREETKPTPHVAEETRSGLPEAAYVKSAGKSKAEPVKPAPEIGSQSLSLSPEEPGSGLHRRTGGPIELAVLLKTGIPGRTHESHVEVETASDLQRDPGSDQKESADTAYVEEMAPTRKGSPVVKTEREQSKKEKPAMLPRLRKRTVLKDKAIPSPGDSEDFLSKAKYVTERAEGKVLSVEYERESTRLRSISVEIPAKHYGSFCQELIRMAELQSPPPSIPDKGLETIRIRMKLIFAE